MYKSYLTTRLYKKYSVVMRCFSEVIEQWPSLTAFATDIGVSVNAANQMKRRGSIPADHWQNLLQAAQARSLPITSDILINIAAEKA